MKNCWLLLMLVCFNLSIAFSQEHTNTALSIGPELNIPQRSGYNIGYGASVKLELPVAASLSIVLTSGLHQFNRKTIFTSADNGGKDTFVPFKGGAKYYLSPYFYTEGELGTVIDRNDGVKQNLFAYSIGTGFLLPFKNSKNSSVDLGFRFEDWSRSRVQQFAIRVAYRFGW